MADPNYKMGEGHALHREAERQVALRASPSVFCVLVDPRHQLPARQRNSQGEERYVTMSGIVTAKEGLDKVPAISVGDGQRNSTGFAIAGKGNKLRILTCAHTVDDVYTAGSHTLNCDKANEMFSFKVYCVHHESEIQAQVTKTSASKRTRQETPARVVAIDTKLDLLVLELDVRQLCLRVEKDKKKTPCKEEHPIIDVAKSNPPNLDKLVLVGWPPQLADSIGTGQVSGCDREYESISSVNIKGYRMKLLQCHGLNCDSGCSGGPVLDGNCECVGVYHAATDTTGYAVSIGDVEAFLHKHKMLTQWEE